MIFLKNLKKLFISELLTEADIYTKEEIDDKFVEVNGDSQINGNLTVKSIKTDNIEIY